MSAKFMVDPTDTSTQKNSNLNKPQSDVVNEGNKPVDFTEEDEGYISSSSNDQLLDLTDSVAPSVSVLDPVEQQLLAQQFQSPPVLETPPAQAFDEDQEEGSISSSPQTTSPTSTCAASEAAVCEPIEKATTSAEEQEPNNVDNEVPPPLDTVEIETQQEKEPDTVQSTETPVDTETHQPADGEGQCATNEAPVEHVEAEPNTNEVPPVDLSAETQEENVEVTANVNTETQEEGQVAKEANDTPPAESIQDTEVPPQDPQDKVSRQKESSPELEPDLDDQGQQDQPSEEAGQESVAGAVQSIEQPQTVAIEPSSEGECKHDDSCASPLHPTTSKTEATEESKHGEEQPKPEEGVKAGEPIKEEGLECKDNHEQEEGQNDSELVVVNKEQIPVDHPYAGLEEEEHNLRTLYEQEEQNMRRAISAAEKDDTLAALLDLENEELERRTGLHTLLGIEYSELEKVLDIETALLKQKILARTLQMERKLAEIESFMKCLVEEEAARRPKAEAEVWKAALQGMVELVQQEESSVRCAQQAVAENGLVDLLAQRRMTEDSKEFQETVGKAQAKWEKSAAVIQRFLRRCVAKRMAGCIRDMMELVEDEENERWDHGIQEEAEREDLENEFYQQRRAINKRREAANRPMSSLGNLPPLQHQHHHQMPFHPAAAGHPQHPAAGLMPLTAHSYHAGASAPGGMMNHMNTMSPTTCPQPMQGQWGSPPQQGSPVGQCWGSNSPSSQGSMMSAQQWQQHQQMMVAMGYPYQQHPQQQQPHPAAFAAANTFPRAPSPATPGASPSPANYQPPPQPKVSKWDEYSDWQEEDSDEEGKAADESSSSPQSNTSGKPIYPLAVNTPNKTLNVDTGLPPHYAHLASPSGNSSCASWAEGDGGMNVATPKFSRLRSQAQTKNLPQAAASPALKQIRPAQQIAKIVLMDDDDTTERPPPPPEHRCASAGSADADDEPPSSMMWGGNSSAETNYEMLDAQEAESRDHVQNMEAQARHEVYTLEAEARFHINRRGSALSSQAQNAELNGSSSDSYLRTSWALESVSLSQESASSVLKFREVLDLENDEELRRFNLMQEEWFNRESLWNGMIEDVHRRIEHDEAYQRSMLFFDFQAGPSMDAAQPPPDNED